MGLGLLVSAATGQSSLSYYRARPLLPQVATSGFWLKGQAVFWVVTVHKSVLAQVSDFYLSEIVERLCSPHPLDFLFQCTILTMYTRKEKCQSFDIDFDM